VRRRRRELLAAGLGVLMAACEWATAPRHFAGTYALVSVEAMALPAGVPGASTGCTVAYEWGRLTLGADAFTLEASVAVRCPVTARTAPATAAGMLSPSPMRTMGVPRISGGVRARRDHLELTPAAREGQERYRAVPDETGVSVDLPAGALGAGRPTRLRFEHSPIR
jgi:hypothetical protein